MSGNHNNWPPHPPFDEDDQTPVPAPTVPQGWAAPAPQPTFSNPPTGQFGGVGNPMTGQFSTSQFSNPPTGQFGNPPTGQFQNGAFQAPANAPQGAAQAFGNPHTGQFVTSQFGNPPTGQYLTGAQPGVAAPSAQFSSPASQFVPVQNYAAPQPGVGNPMTGTFDRPVLHAPLATPPPMQAVTVVTPRMRAIYGGGGAGFGLFTGVFLGILNSALEGVSLAAGMPMTAQISLWFALLFGIACGTKPERVERVLRSYNIIE